MTTSLAERISLYRHAMELLAAGEIEKQLHSFPIELVKAINKTDAIAYALNRLSPLYFTTQKGWNWQQERVKKSLGELIATAPWGIRSAHPSTYSSVKRLIDIVGSLVGLLILALVFIPIVVAIKLDSPGSIFFSQRRYGLYGRPFKIRKFRTMVENAEALKASVINEATGPIFKNKLDPRVTRVGRFLRRTSLDELPQFWNVLVGEMSLVGTRPPTRDEVIHYSDRHWLRLNVMPGLTGVWQVSGRSEVKDFEAVVELDLRYQRWWSPWYDLTIILKTIRVVLMRLGAC